MYKDLVGFKMGSTCK
uniref:Uncharacterized protein n=1 Tax=Arundo donax TaxID=35708 RepID=A0A0A8ZL25_ARUDO